MGKAKPGKLGDEDVPGVGRAARHVEEDGEGRGEEAIVPGVGVEEFGGEDGIGIEASA